MLIDYIKTIACVKHIYRPKRRLAVKPGPRGWKGRDRPGTGAKA